MSFKAFIKLNRFSKGKMILCLCFFILTAVICSSFTTITYSKYTSKLGSALNSARVARWSVNIQATDNDVYVITSDSASLAWSSPYELSIINNSEVLASYGHANTADGEQPSNAFHSYVTFSNIPSSVNHIRIVNGDNGVAQDFSAIINSNTAVICFDGYLECGQTRKYYVQFASDLGSSVTDYDNGTIEVTTEFKFEQAFRTYENTVSGT